VPHWLITEQAGGSVKWQGACSISAYPRSATHTSVHCNRDLVEKAEEFTACTIVKNQVMTKVAIFLEGQNGLNWPLAAHRFSR
jgi:hypothetical protein